MFSEYNKERENIPKWLSFYSYDPVGSQWHHQWQNLGPSLNIDITQNEVQDFLKNTLVHALCSLYGKTSKKYRKKYQPNLLLHSYGIHTNCRESSRQL